MFLYIRRLLQFLLSLGIFGTVVFFTLFIGVYFYVARDLPSFGSLDEYHPPVLAQVFDNRGERLGEFWTERRIRVPIAEVPQMVSNAFLAAEDTRFYQHHGVDFRGVFRAFLANLKAGDIVQGGSTITQQITRSLLLTRERTWQRKIKEAILATRLERRLTKAQILELYLNQIYFGNRAYGIVAAAENYFHKKLSELNIAEMALLGGMPRAPSQLSPLENPERARERQIYVLDRMREEKMITEEQYQEALVTKIQVYVAKTDKEQNEKTAPYFLEQVRAEIREQFGEDVLYHSGLKIYTTVDVEIQKSAQEALRNGLEIIDRRQGWHTKPSILSPSEVPTVREQHHREMIQISQETVTPFPQKTNPSLFEKTPLIPNKIYHAIVTGFEGMNTKIFVGRHEGILPPKEVQWTRPFNTEQIGYDDVKYISDPRQRLKVGMVLQVRPADVPGNFRLYQEPKVQGALFALDNDTGAVRAIVGGYDFVKSEFNRATQALRQPGSSFKPFVYAAALDKGYTFQTMVEDAPIIVDVNETETWVPKNYEDEYHGPTPFRSCLVHSMNVPTVKIARDIGMPYLISYARKLGLTSPIAPYLSASLGANGVYLKELVTAYATFANGGYLRTPYTIKKITDASGKILFERKEEALQKQEETKTETKALELTPAEQKILYGNNIPEGHVITPQTAFLMTTLLQGVVQNGTGWKMKELKKPVAGKTGTTNDETDAWFIGFVPQMTGGVWVGFDNPAQKIGKKEAGGRTAAPIFLEFLQKATQSWEVKNFEPPSDFDMQLVDTTPGGSALFAEKKPEPNPEGGSLERSIDFFEEDLKAMPEGAADPLQGVADPLQGVADPLQGVADPRVADPLQKEPAPPIAAPTPPESPPQETTDYTEF